MIYHHTVNMNVCADCLIMCRFWNCLWKCFTSYGGFIELYWNFLSYLTLFSKLYQHLIALPYQSIQPHTPVYHCSEYMDFDWICCYRSLPKFAIQM